ncbi:MAG: undecaprenyl-diphosphate phosphatase [Deltaproteobacteria bacterium]|nr:undecaprenyl-diphosphate phosphatase [Deltaproteobacteria bacterium]
MESSDQNLIAVILGIIQGITEFIPVSSTGHLIIAGHSMGFTGAKANTFEIFIQGGTVLAVVMLYWRYFLGLFDFSSKQSFGAGFRGFSGIGKLAVAAFPVMAVGLVSHRYIKEYLFSPFTVSIGLIAGAIIMLVADRPRASSRRNTLDEITFLEAFLVGLAQVFALWPGVSRSGATIIGGLVAGFHRKVAAEFSFILAVPVLSAAVIYDLIKNLSLLGAEDLKFFALGFFVSCVFGILSIKVLLRILSTHTFMPFALYRIVLGVFVLVL